MMGVNEHVLLHGSMAFAQQRNALAPSSQDAGTHSFCTGKGACLHKQPVMVHCTSHAC